MPGDQLRAFCRNLPGVTEDIKWDGNLCFLVANKLFCLVPLQGDLMITLKCSHDDYVRLCQMKGFKSAPYFGRFEWILVEDPETIPEQELFSLIEKSYQIIKKKLPVKIRESLR